MGLLYGRTKDVQLFGGALFSLAAGGGALGWASYRREEKNIGAALNGNRYRISYSMALANAHHPSRPLQSMPQGGNWGTNRR